MSKTTFHKKNELYITIMKLFWITLLGAGLTACADSPNPSPTASVGNAPYARYDSGRNNSSPANSPLRRMTTAQLQARRLELYKTVPYGQTRKGVPYYIYRGQPLPQQDEILAIESELNRRYQAGDKAAELKRPIPGTYHIS